MMSQLILNLDDALLSAAQAYAQRKGQQLETLITDFLQATIQAPAPQPAPARPFSPRVQRLFGSVPMPPGFDYKESLTEALRERHGV